VAFLRGLWVTGRARALRVRRRTQKFTRPFTPIASIGVARYSHDMGDASAE
jgi:hypothetical protein